MVDNLICPIKPVLYMVENGKPEFWYTCRRLIPYFCQYSFYFIYFSEQPCGFSVMVLTSPWLNSNNMDCSFLFQMTWHESLISLYQEITYCIVFASCNFIYYNVKNIHIDNGLLFQLSSNWSIFSKCPVASFLNEIFQNTSTLC